LFIVDKENKSACPLFKSLLMVAAANAAI